MVIVKTIINFKFRGKLNNNTSLRVPYFQYEPEVNRIVSNFITNHFIHWILSIMTLVFSFIHKFNQSMKIIIYEYLMTD